MTLSQKRYLIAMIFLMVASNALSQDARPQKRISLSLLNNAVTLPFGGKAGIFHSPLHPGIMIGYGKQINKKQIHKFFLDYKFGYVYQQRVQHAVHLYPELGYRFQYKALGIEGAAGAGYLHSFSDLQQFKITNAGTYEQYGRGGRPSFLASLSFGIGYTLARRNNNPLFLFTRYQLLFQGPFVRSYVPVLPNAALHIGVSMNLNKTLK